ncbi:MAG: hypothetical protein SPJ13_00595 [Bacteroidales bacterium]|nr:hypothetical protein [Bacteroidales bacterium]
MCIFFFFIIVIFPLEIEAGVEKEKRGMALTGIVARSCGEQGVKCECHMICRNAQTRVKAAVVRGVAGIGWAKITTGRGFMKKSIAL